METTPACSQIRSYDPAIMAGLKTIISLSFVRQPFHHCPFGIEIIFVLLISLIQVLAIGFLLVILSSTLWRNQYLPLVVVATYVVAPLPNWICGRASSSDDFMDSGSNAVAEFGWFLTAFFVVMGVGKHIRIIG